MPKYRKLPVVIDATQWFRCGDHPQDDSVVMHMHCVDGLDLITEGKIVRYYRTPDGDSQTLCKHCGIVMYHHGWIDTLEGGHIVCPGDYIITGVKGEMYPCKPDIFEAIYEAVAD